MDKMDRNWESFKNPFQNPFQNLYKIFIQFAVVIVDWYGRLTETERFLMRISCSVVYYLVIASLAYYLTRERGDYYAHQNLGRDTDIWPPFQYKLEWAIVVFFIFITISI